MVIVQMEGGLGNQMFQYALYLNCKARGVNAKLDVSKYDSEFSHNGYELEKIFSINEKYCSAGEKLIIKPLSKLLHFLVNHSYKEKNEWQWKYQQDVASIKFGFIKGYWQSEKYFITIAETLRDKFKFPPLQDIVNKKLLDKINQVNSVSLHIRRGDYLLGQNAASLGIGYYNRSIAFINEKLNQPHYFIFSDDIEWAKQNIQVSNGEFIDWNTGSESFVDMQLMSECKHNIIANSSFSWWGGWLNNNSAKIVIAPEQWMPHMEGTADAIPENWIQLPANFQ